MRQIIEKLEHLANKLRDNPRWVDVVVEAIHTLRKDEANMGIAANVINSLESLLTTATASNASNTATIASQGTQIASLTAQLAALQAEPLEDAADTASFAQAITNYALAPDGTLPVTPPPTPAS